MNVLFNSKRTTIVFAMVGNRMIKMEKFKADFILVLFFNIVKMVKISLTFKTNSRLRQKVS